MDAWSIVDAVDRLRGLIGTRGNIMRGFAPFNEFRTKTASTRTLRNNCDHLGQKLDLLASRELPVHGVLGWVASLPNGNGYIGLFKGGTFIGQTQEDPLINPVGRRCSRPIGLATSAGRPLLPRRGDHPGCRRKWAPSIRTNGG